MRIPIIAALTLASSQVALAQTAVAPPSIAAPSAKAPMDERATWCDQYTSWLMATAPATGGAATDSQEVQHLQVELNFCKIDPQQYENDTRVEAEAALAQG